MIRSAEPGDAEAVLALMADLGRPKVAREPSAPWAGSDPDQFRDTQPSRLAQADVFLAHLDDPDAEIFVAELDGTVAGAVSLVFRPRLNWTTPEAWIPDLYVDPGFRRRGVARALLDACAVAARKRGCHRLILESGHERAEAHQLYEGYGFVHSGRAYGLAL